MIHCEIPRGLRKSYKQMVYKHFISELKKDFTTNPNNQPRFKVGDTVTLPTARTFASGECWYPDGFSTPLPEKVTVKSVVVQDCNIHEKIFWGRGSQELDEITTTWNLHQEMRNLVRGCGLYWALYFVELPNHGSFSEKLFI